MPTAPDTDQARTDLVARFLRPGTARVLDALQAGDGDVRFVGGCVRDALLGRPFHDIDMATPLPPDAVIAALKAARIKAIPTGLKHGTVTAVSEGNAFEITTLRVDIETDGRHAIVAFTTDWQADATRRDFTMNAMSLDRSGRLFDYFGGLTDARAGRVRFIGDADRRILEDVLRILRFFRFHAYYGHGALDGAGLAACARLADRIPGLSGERVRDETLKLLGAPDPAPVWQAMIEAGVAVHVLGHDGALGRLTAVARSGLPGAADPLLRLAALLETEADTVAAAARLRLSNKQARRLRAAVALRGVVQDVPAGPPLRRLLYHHGCQAIADVAVQAAAVDATAPWPDWHAELDGWQQPSLPISGRDVARYGVPQGPGTGRLVRAVEQWWIDQDFSPDRKACLEKLESLMS